VVDGDPLFLRIDMTKTLDSEMWPTIAAVKTLVLLLYRS
jgi:hypothetical protein